MISVVMSYVTVPPALVLPSAIVYLIACDLRVGSILRAAAKCESITFAEQPKSIIRKVLFQCFSVQILTSTMIVGDGPGENMVRNHESKSIGG